MKNKILTALSFVFVAVCTGTYYVFKGLDGKFVSEKPVSDMVMLITMFVAFTLVNIAFAALSDFDIKRLAVFSAGLLAAETLVSVFLFDISIVAITVAFGASIIAIGAKAVFGKSKEKST